MANGGIVGKFNPTSAGPGTAAEKITTVNASGSFVAGTHTNQADILLIAGGGAVRGGPGGTGGGGAGGMVQRPAASITGGTTYPITIGAGGQRANPSPNVPTPAVGGDTTGFGLTAKGGGSPAVGTNATDRQGGSGGGGQEHNNAAGNATQPNQAGDSGTYGYGHAGGAGNQQAQGGGGGGAGGSGSPASSLHGGSGRAVDYASPSASPSSTTYCGGGGGAGNSKTGGNPGPGGGGGGSFVGQYNGNGGDGRVVVREAAASVVGIGKGVWRLQTVYDKRRSSEWPGENTV
jgi:hypothetical protein